MNKQSAILTESDFRAAISKQCGFPSANSWEGQKLFWEGSTDGVKIAEYLKSKEFPSILQTEEDKRRHEFNAHDDGRSDGYGESYAERNL